MGEFFRQEIAPKNGLDFFIGAKEEDFAKIQNYRAFSNWQNFNLLRKGPKKVPVSVDGFNGAKELKKKDEA